MKINEITLNIDYLIENILWEDYTEVIFEYTDVKMSPCFNKTNRKHLKSPRMQTALRNFLIHKAENPQEPYGSKDYPMLRGGPFRGIKHAGLSDDVSVMYEIKNNTIYLLAIGSHSDLGIGNTANPKKQKQLAKRIISYCKDENI